MNHMKLLSEFKLLRNKEISILKQKACCRWLEQEDINSIFHLDGAG